MNPTNASSSHSTSKTSSTPFESSLRPRTRRLISGLDGESDQTIHSAQGTRKPFPFASPFNTRAASPIPSSHPSRADSLRPPPNSNPSTNGRTPGGLNQESGQETAASFAGIWGNSWSAIQGLASNVLGSDTSSKDKQPRIKRPLEATHRRTSSSALPKQWGPSASPGPRIGVGSREERENMVRAMKRKDLLVANEQMFPDAAGRIKRRNSDDRLSVSAPPVEHEDRDALVYVHRVRPEDTLAGLTIRFNCQAAVLRKANRMWPNDSIQTRKTIVLPVDACGVKGRPVPDAINYEEDDLLLGGYGNGSAENDRTPTPISTLSNGWQYSTNQGTSSPRPSSCTTSSHADSESPWKHDSWVILPNETTPTEIARLPRRTLGFFPPARRKSLTFSDTATPSSSFDLPRSSLSTNSTTSHTHSSSLTSTKNGSTTTITSNSPRTHPRPRKTSMSNFVLHGPGGVGTLDKNVRRPGPAQDGLNKLFASHLPNVAPPSEQEYFTPWYPGLQDADADPNGSDAPISFRTGIGDRRVAPRGGGLDLENVGGAIEGWMRKMASRASTILSESSSGSGGGKGSAVPVIGAVGGDLGDLIELRDDAFDVGGDGENEEVGRWRYDTGSLIKPSGSAQYENARKDAGPVIKERGRGRSRGTKND